jgi:dipeptidyl-peptidase III
MKMLRFNFFLTFFVLFLNACKENVTMKNKNDDFYRVIDQFADIRILRYEIPGFEELSLNQKQLLYYLSEAALCGRDILFDQQYKHNLLIISTLEAIYEGYAGDRNSTEFEAFVVYLKRVWFASGIHHHYSTDKFIPNFNETYFKTLLTNTPASKLEFTGLSIDSLYNKLTPIIFNAEIDAKRVNLDVTKGLVSGSANNFYDGVTDEEAEYFYAEQKKLNNNKPLEYGLNSRLIKVNGQLKEEVYKIDGRYGAAIEKIVYWLDKAKVVAENEHQKLVIESLIKYYKFGDLQDWMDYNIEWVQDTMSHIDFINGFIEVYGDATARKATWESVVNFRDEEATKRATILSKNAQWFEDNSPVDQRFKKEKVQGISAKVITVVQLGGDCFPHSPIGINLPNSDFVRKEYGSKSVTLSNIINSQFQTSLNDGMLEEFAYSAQEVELAKKYGVLALDLHVDMHECLGHGSGQMLPGITSEHLKNHHSTIEETRADLFALYYVMDEKLINFGLVPNFDVAKAEYNSYIKAGLMTQLTRVELGKDLEESHMRNRQLIAKWVYEKGKPDNVIERKQKEGKTYFVVNDHVKLRQLFGDLLAEVQRIKSEGDYGDAKNLVENYGVKIEYDLHKEVLERYKKLNVAPFAGFINPVLKPILRNHEIIDVTVEYPDNYFEQMMHYSKNYGFLR